MNDVTQLTNTHHKWAADRRSNSHGRKSSLFLSLSAGASGTHKSFRYRNMEEKSHQTRKETTSASRKNSYVSKRPYSLKINKRTAKESRPAALLLESPSHQDSRLHCVYEDRARKTADMINCFLHGTRVRCTHHILLTFVTAVTSDHDRNLKSRDRL